METLDSLILKYNKIYLFGTRSKTSRELQKMISERGRKFTEVWDENPETLGSVNNLMKMPKDLSKITDGIVILAMEPRYLTKWIEECEKNLGTDYVDGFELVYWDLYQECQQKGMDNLLKRCKTCRASYHSCPIRREYYHNERTKTLRQLAFKAGFICNLKCEYCCEFLPYFKKNNVIDFDVNAYKEDLKKISESCEYIHTLSFSGGDVMLNPELSQLLDYVVTLENIGDIYILTNGTYMPKDIVLDALQRNRESVHIVINDYEINKKAGKLIDELENRGVPCRLRTNDGWYDFTDLSFRDRSEEELKNLYRNCAFDCTDTSYYIYCNGIISMRCGVANGILHYLDLYDQLKEEYADVRHTPVNKLAGELDRIEKKGFVKMCNYCKGCRNEERVLQPAEIQLNNR